MKNKLMFNNLSTSNLSDPSEKEVAIRDFGGVDHSHSTLFVDTSRAVEMSNFIKDGGINQKRTGFREIFQFEPRYNTTATGVDITYVPVNGVWELTTSKYNEVNMDYDRTKYLIVQGGNQFYSIKRIHYENGVEIVEEGITTDANEFESQYTIRAEPIETLEDFSTKIDDNKSYGVVYNEVLYILTGKLFLMIGVFDDVLQVRKVEDDKYTYIPTTTTFIPPNEYNSLLDDPTQTLSSVTYEQVNMMTRFRKNKLLGLTLATLEVYGVMFQISVEGLMKNENGTYVDANKNVVELKPYKYLDSKDKIDGDKQLVFTYTLDSLPFNSDAVSYITEVNKTEDAIKQMKVYATGRAYTPYGELILENDEVLRVNDVSNFYKDKKVAGLMYTVKYEITSVEDGIAYGKCDLIFNYPVIPTTSQNVISVEYPRHIKLADKINKCSFGCMYGYSNMNRLFVSGNEGYPNMDFHTVEAYIPDELDSNKTASEKYSLTYFGDLGYSKIGGVVNEINGYAILGDGKMAVFKSLHGQDPTIYFRTASTISEDIKDINGNSYTKITEVFPIQVGTIGEGNINHNTIQNLNGDTLMLSNNGVFGIELDSNVASSQRWAKRRSRLIDPALKKYDLKNAVCITYDDKFYLCLEGGKVFIADARYPIVLEDDLADEFQYEWWEWDNINARLFFTLDNQLWFGTDTGMLCCFTDVNYKDTTSLDIDKAGVCYVEQEKAEYNDKFVISPQYISSLESMSDEDDLYISQNIYALGFDTAIPNVSFDKTTIIYDYSQSENKEELVNFLLTLPNYEIYFDRIPESNKDVIEVNQRYKFLTVLNNEEEEKIYYDTYKVSIKYIEQEVGNPIEDEITEELNFDNEGFTRGFRVCFKLDTGVQTLCNIGIEIDGEYYLYQNYREESGKYYFVNEEGLTTKELESKPKFNMFSIRDYTNKGNPVTILNYNNETPVITNAKFVFNKNVSCYYITPPFDMGTRYYNKDLRKLIIVPDTLLGTSVDFGFKTSNYEKDYNAYTGKTFDFNDLDFDNLNFLTESFAKVYVKQARKKRWSYIQFYFKSDTNNNCKINNLTVIYTIATKNKGVR